MKRLNRLRDIRFITAGLLVAVLALLVVVHAHPGLPSGSRPAPRGITVSPQGDAVDRLTPVSVRFRSAPSQRDGSHLLQVQPPVQGTYTWQDDKTLLFQPDFPGLLRGRQYRVDIKSDDPKDVFQPFWFQFTTAGALTIDSVLPAPDDVEVPANAQVLVQFSRSVAPLTTLAQQPKDAVVLFDPPLQGTGEWLNTSLYRFTPDPAGVRPFTKYALRVPAKVSPDEDGSLANDYVWSYTTFSPALDSVTPAANSKFASPTQQVRLKFNQPMVHDSVEAGLRVSLGNDAVAGTFAWLDDTSVTFTPSQKLAPAARYDVFVPKGLKGQTGGETRVEWRSVFETVGLPRVTLTSPRDGDQNAQRYGISLSFSNPMDADSVESRVSVTGLSSDDLRPMLSGDGLNLSVNARLDVTTNYALTIADGAVDRYGQPLGPYTMSFRTGERAPFVALAIPGPVGTYSATTEPKLYFQASNYKDVTFTLYPLTPSEISAIQTRGYIDNSSSPYIPSSKPLYSWTEDASGPKDEVVVRATSLSRTGGPLAKGDYLVRANTTQNYQGALAFSVVDTALITKVSYDELLVWALDLDTGTPLANMTVAGTGSPLPAGATATTDAQGLASFKLPNIVDAIPPYTQNRSYRVTLEAGGRKGVAVTNWQRGAYTYGMGLPIETYPRRYVANVYTERPIYRPGEDVPYKATIRQDDDADYRVPDDSKDMFMTITDPQQKQLIKAPIQLNDAGTFAGSIHLADEALTGNYSLVVSWEPDPKYKVTLNSTSFAVAEFRKPEFQVTTSTIDKSYVAGDDIQAQVEATYYFGGPLEGAPVQWSAVSNSYAPRFKGYERYTFTDFDANRTSVYKAPLRSEGSAVVNSRGLASFTIPAVISGNEGAQQYQIGATVSDDSAQAVAGATSVIVYPAAVYAGVRPANYVATTGKQSGLDLVTVDTDGKPAPNRDVVVKVYDRTWVTSKEATADGARRYTSVPKDTLLDTLNVTTGADAKASVPYTPAKAGSLRIVVEVTDDKGRIERSSTNLYVSGGSYASWQFTNDDSMKLIADRDQYQVGDTAEVLVPAPFQGAIGLVTVERGKVITRNVQQFPTNSERLEVPIVDHDVPNVFVSTILYRPPTNEDPIARYKVGYVELPVSIESRVLNVKVTPDRDQAKPGDTVHYDVKVTDWRGVGVPAEVSVAVVDKALLSLADERGTDGLKAFWYERGLGIITASSLSVSIDRANDVISEAAMSGGKGGDGTDDERIRQDFRNTALWTAQLKTDANGNAGYDVVMPDNLTTWHSQVRAVSGNIMVGEGDNELISTQPLLLRPALPRFLRVGDTPSLRVLVRNATKAPTEVTVTLDADGVTLGAPKDQTVHVEPNSSTLAVWPATVPQDGTAKLTFTARNSAGPGTGDAVKMELPVYQAITPETTATGGVVTDKTVQESVYLPPYQNVSQGSLTVTVQASLIKALGPELKNFGPFDPEGPSTIASRVIAQLAVKKADPTATVRSQDGLRSDVASLLRFQRSDGGFAWCARCSSDPQMTALALITLGDWRRAGNSVDSNVLTRAVSYLNNYVNRFRDVDRPADVNEKAYMLYAEATATGSSGYVANLRALFEQYRAQLSNSGRAYILLGMAEAGIDKKDPEVHTLLDDVTAAVNASANGNHWEDPPARSYTNLQSSPRTTALMLDALVHLDPKHPLIEETVRWLRVALTTKVSRTELERAQTIRSLADYGAMTGEFGADYTYSVKLDSDQVLAGRLKSDGDPISEKLSLKTLALGKTHLISLLRDFKSKGRLYYSTDLRYVTPATSIEALNRGMAVSHEYSQVDNSGRPVKLGDVVRVKLTVMLPADRNYVVVDDYLPAGLEAIDPQLKTTDVKLKAQLDKERVDASRPANLDYYAPWLHWYYNPWQQVDLRDDHVSLQAQSLTKGVYEFVYYARATTPGEFYVPPAHVEESFFPEVFGRSDSARFVIQP